MSSQAARTGDSNNPDCEQKWQSSGQPQAGEDPGFVQADSLLENGLAGGL